MTGAPKRIWATPSLTKALNAPHKNLLDETAIDYVRADIADDMLEALQEAVWDYNGPDQDPPHWVSEARAAIAKAE